MLIRLGYDIQFELPAPVAMVALLNVHPSRAQDLLEPDELQTEPRLEIAHYIDGFGNRCARFVAPQGLLRLYNSTLIQDSGEPDEVNWYAREHAVGELPNEVLGFLLNSRYCEVDRFSSVAFELFGHIHPGWGRVQAICNWVNNKVAFNYQHARPDKNGPRCLHRTRGGVPRLSASGDHFLPFAQHSGALCDGVSGRHRRACRLPMDFSAWFEVYLSGRWWAFDARNNQPRIGRVLMATGRDASDVAMTTSFGQAPLSHFFVVTDEETAMRVVA